MAEVVVLEWAGAVFRWVVGAVVPMFARPVPPVGLAWFVHAVLLVGVIIGLFFAQPPFLQNINRGPVGFRAYWLPTLFVLLYLLCWSAVWLWVLLSPERGGSAFPELDAAWDEIVVALERAGLGLADTPLFLVFGDFPAGFDALFRGLPGGTTVAGGSSPGSPLRAYANRDGIYLAVPGASLLGVQVWFAGPDDGSTDAAPRADGEGLGESIGVDVNQSIGIDKSMDESIRGSMAEGGLTPQMLEIARIVRRARDEGRKVTDQERSRIQQLSVPTGRPASAPGRPRSGQSVLNNPQLLAQGTARLSYVCDLVASARWPLCPVNGAIVAVPVSATDRDDAQQWGLVAQADLANATAALRLRFPVFALVGGLECLPGGAAFFRRFAPGRAAQRLGKGFPLNPDLSAEAARGEIEKSVVWVFGRLLPYHVFRQMKVDAPADAADAAENVALFRFLAELRRRTPRLARLVSRVATDGKVPPVFGGCYVAVVEGGEVPFAGDFFKNRVDPSQAAVAWTTAAYAEDKRHRTGAFVGSVVLAVVLFGVIALAAYTVFVRR